MTTTTKERTATTVAQFRRQAERVFLRGNAEAAAAGVKFTWKRAVRVTWADRSKGFSGTVTVEAAGFRTRDMIATATDGAVMVR